MMTSVPAPDLSPPLAPVSCDCSPSEASTAGTASGSAGAPLPPSDRLTSCDFQSSWETVDESVAASASEGAVPPEFSTGWTSALTGSDSTDELASSVRLQEE